MEPVRDIEKDLDKTLPELADPPKYCIPSENGGFINEYEEGLQHIVDTWKKMRSEPKKMVLAILHAVDIIAEYLSSVDIEEAQRGSRAMTEGSLNHSSLLLLKGI